MTTQSLTTSVRTREVIGVDQFSQRREVFDKYDTVFLPLSPVSDVPLAHMEAHTNVTDADDGRTTNFKRNTLSHSSMREPRTEDRNIEFRTRKYSDNFLSESNQSDDVDYRRNMTERTNRLSKLRREFLNSNLHEPSNNSPFYRRGTRATMPAGGVQYKIESPNLFKFPFAEPFATPPPTRRGLVALDPVNNGELKNEDPETRQKYQSLSHDNTSPTIDQQRLFEELVKRYSPQRKPVDWKLPPTRPRIVGSVPKSTSSQTESLGSTVKHVEMNYDNDVFVKISNDPGLDTIDRSDDLLNIDVSHKLPNGLETSKMRVIKNEEVTKENDSKTSLTEIEETKDTVPELSKIHPLSGPSKRIPSEKFTDLSIPALIEKISEEGENLNKKSESKKNIKRKRSFLDKLLGRKKEK